MGSIPIVATRCLKKIITGNTKTGFVDVSIVGEPKLISKVRLKLQRLNLTLTGAQESQHESSHSFVVCCYFYFC